MTNLLEHSKQIGFYLRREIVYVEISSVATTSGLTRRDFLRPPAECLAEAFSGVTTAIHHPHLSSSPVSGPSSLPGCKRISAKPPRSIILSNFILVPCPSGFSLLPCDFNCIF